LQLNIPKVIHILILLLILRCYTIVMKKIFSIFILLTFFLSFKFVFADSSNGTIDPNNDASQYALVCHDAACSPGAAGKINFQPTLGTGVTAISINPSGVVTGNAWGGELGWINMNPTGGGVVFDSTTGIATGTAWSQVAGWINFGITTSPSVSRVTIDNNGNWNGYAWASGTNGGWIKFSCPGTDTCVNTDWRIVSLRIPPSGSVGGGGGGGGIVINTGGIIPSQDATKGLIYNQQIRDTEYLTQTGPQSQPNDYANNYRTDINDSGQVDIFDYNLLIVDWGRTNAVDKTKTKPDRCKTADRADLNCDGQVDLLDFNVMMIYWATKLNSSNQTK
jgi:hypothetical protein